MTNRGQFSQLLASGLMVQMFDYLEEHPEEFSQFLDVETSDSAFEDFQKFAGIGPARRKGEGEQIQYDDPIQGGSKRAIHETYALGWIVTKEMKADDKYGLIKQIPGEFAGSMRHVQEQTGANLLNLGFSTVTTVDGVSLFNTAHPLLGDQGLQLSNQHASNAGLSQTALQDMMVLGENYTNDRGLKRFLKPTDLWIPPEQQWVAKRILKSSLEPGTGNNDINVTEDLVKVHILHYLTSTIAWFMSTKGKNKLKFFTRQKPNLEASDDFDTKGSKHSVDARFSAVAQEFYGWFGSTGVGG